MRWVLRLVLAGLWLILLASALGRYSPLFDLANLVQLPAALAAAGLALVILVRSQTRLTKAVLALLAAAAGLFALPPQSAPDDCAPDAARLRIAWLNAQGSNNPAPIMEWLDKELPDLVGFAEMGSGSPAILAEMDRRYPYFQSCLEGLRCSTALFSREKPLEMAPLGYGDPNNRNGLSAARMTLALPGIEQPLNLIALHLSRPLPLGDQREELGVIERQIRQPADTIMIGDFNVNARMHTMRGFTARNGLLAANADAPTWPLSWKGQRAIPLLQIDHMLLGRNWAVESLRVSGDLGSDHRGLIGDLCRRI